MEQSSKSTRRGAKKSGAAPKSKNPSPSVSGSTLSKKTKSKTATSGPIPSKIRDSPGAVVPRRAHKATVAGKNSEKIITPVGTYTVRPIVPAQKAELISVAKAMHREDMGSRLQMLFRPETEAAVEAIQTGIYVSWRCPEFTWDCIRVSRMSRCFCGHLLNQHASFNGRSVRVPCRHPGCPCKAYQFIPGRVEDIGEFWHQKRRDFDPASWRAKCCCKHTHEEHECKTSLRRCRHSGCGCGSFNSNFLCAACDRHWEEHVTVFETEEDRRKTGIPCGESHLPFAEMPNLRNMALTGDETEAGPLYRAITDGQGPIPHSRAITQDTPVRTPRESGFKPVWD